MGSCPTLKPAFIFSQWIDPAELLAIFGLKPLVSIVKESSDHCEATAYERMIIMHNYINLRNDIFHGTQRRLLCKLETCKEIVENSEAYIVPNDSLMMEKIYWICITLIKNEI